MVTRLTSDLGTFLRKAVRVKIALGTGLAFAGLAAVAATTSIGAEPGLARHDVGPDHATRNGYRLLRFTGAPMKWGTGRLGSEAVVTWRIAETKRRFAGARNCGRLQPIEAALEPSDITRESFETELRAAMRMWQDVAGITFRHVRPGERADLVLGAQTRPRGRAFTNVSATQMVKVGMRRRIDRLDQAIICLNPKRRWKVGFDGDLKIYDLRHTLAHELGHVIGLDHVGPSGAVMAFRYDEKHMGLTRGDVVGAQRIYGLPSFLRRKRKAVNLVSYINR